MAFYTDLCNIHIMEFLITVLVAVSIFCNLSDAAVTQGELSDSMASIAAADTNAATGVTVNLQALTSTSSTSDIASGSLFSHVNDVFYLSRPTYAAFLALLDNYNPAIGHAEQTSDGERREMVTFLREISTTAVMQKTLHFLHTEGFVGPTWSSLETTLTHIWFDLYPRRGHTPDSSGFEHVFVGETDAKGVVGFHNWIQYHLQEKAGNLNYMGYIFSKPPHIVGTHFTWHGKTKRLGSMMYGTSPEFDMAMYTVCYLARRNQDCDFSITGDDVRVRAYDIYRNGAHHIGSSYLN